MASRLAPTQAPARTKAEPGRAVPHRAAPRIPRPPWGAPALPAFALAHESADLAAARQTPEPGASVRLEPAGGGAVAAPPPPEPPPPPNRTGLPDRLKAGVEALSGLAMDDVRVHRDSPEPAKLGALAYAKGSDIHLGPGQERHLPHEAWHVVQQKQGRVAPTQLVGKHAVNDDKGLEREATILGQRALRMMPARPGWPASCSCPACSGATTLTAPLLVAPPASATVQRTTYETEAEAHAGFDARYQVSLHGRLRIGGAAPIDQWAISESSRYTLDGGDVRMERDHAEDEFIGWSETKLGAFFDGVIRPNYQPAGPVPAGHIFEIEMSLFGLTASPCSSAHGTSNKPLGCTEELIDLATNNLPGLPYAFQITVEADHYYQPSHLTRAVGRAASQAAVADMQAAGITVTVGH